MGELQEVEKEIEEHEPGRKPKKKTITAMEYLYEADLEGNLTRPCTQRPVAMRQVQGMDCLLGMSPHKVFIHHFCLHRAGVAILYCMVVRS